MNESALYIEYAYKKFGDNDRKMSCVVLLELQRRTEECFLGKNN